MKTLPKFDYQILNRERTTLRSARNLERRQVLSALNKLSTTSIESKIGGIHALVYLANSGFDIKNDLKNDSFIFHVLFYIYIYQISEPNPDFQILCNVMYLLKLTNIVDIDEANHYRQINSQASFQDLPINTEITSLADQVSIEFLLNALTIPYLCYSSLTLLNFIVKKRHNVSQISQIFNSPLMIELCKNRPDLPFGPIVYFYFQDSFHNDHFDQNFLFKTEPETFNQICTQMLISDVSLNNIYLIKIFRLLCKMNSDENPMAQFAGLFTEFVNKLPKFILSNKTSLIESAISFVPNLNPIPDEVLNAVWIVLPHPFKQNHGLAFDIVMNNLERIASAYPPEHLFEQINTILSNPKSFIKEGGIKLLSSLSTVINPTIYIDLETIVSFLDDPKYALTVLPLLLVKVQQMQNDGQIEQCLEILSDNTDQLESLNECGNPDVATLSTNLLNIIREEPKT